MKTQLLPLFLFFLFFLSPAMAEEKLTLDQVKRQMALWPETKISLSYEFTPSFYRHKEILFRCSYGAVRLDSHWQGPRGVRHDVVLVNPKEGIFQGEYYRDGYPLLFYKPLSEGWDFLLSSLEEAEAFAGSVLLWYAVPKAMVQLLPEKGEYTPLLWKGPWGKDFRFEIQWEEGGKKLKRFSLFHNKNKSQLTYEVVETKAVGAFLFMPSKINFSITSAEGVQKTSVLALSQTHSAHFDEHHLYPSQEPYLAVQDFHLLSTSEYDKLLAGDGYNPRLLLSQAKAYILEKNLSAAQKFYMKALEAKPQSGMIYYELLGVCIARGNLNSIWQILFQAQSSRVPDVHRLYFLTAKTAKGKNLQRSLYEQGLQRYPYQEDAMEAFSKVGKPAKVMEYALKALSKEPGNAVFQKALEEVIEKVPWDQLNPQKRVAYRQSLEELKKENPAEKFFERILTKMPSY